MAFWAAPVLSVLTKFVVRRTSSSSGRRGSPAARRKVQAVHQSAYRCTCCSFRCCLSSIVKTTVSGVGGVETARNTEASGTPMQHFFLELPRNDPPSPPCQAGNWLVPGMDGFAAVNGTSRWQGLTHHAARKPSVSPPHSFNSPEKINDFFGAAQPRSRPLGRARMVKALISRKFSIKMLVASSRPSDIKKKIGTLFVLERFSVRNCNFSLANI